MIAGQRIPAGPGFATILPDLDFETYSEVGYIWDGKKWQGLTKTQRGIAAVGASVYSEHPSTEVLSLAYDLKDGVGPRLWVPGCPPPADLFAHIAGGGLLEAHNSGFEFYIWLNVCQARMGWPPLPLHQLRCSMAKARAHSLPGALGKVAAVLEAPEQKDPGGEALLRKLSVPRNPTKNNRATRITPGADPEAFGRLYAYNVQDIKAEAAVSARCPDLSPEEMDLWLLDQAINVRGVYIDQQAMADCISIVNQAFERYTVELREITTGTVQTAGELAKIQGWLGANGVQMSSLDADAVEAALKRRGLPPSCQRVLEIRASLGAASVKKLFAIERRVSRDGRLRDLFAYCGADRTGRWAGRGPQPQNLPASGPDVVRCPACGAVYWAGLLHCRACGALRGPDCKADWGIDAVDAALVDISTRDLARVEAQWGDAVAAVSGCLRGLFAAAPGRDLLCSDFSAIEAVVLAELAGEEWRQEVFRTHGKIYEKTASDITGIPFDDIIRHKKDTGTHHECRKKYGKIPELASGYGGGLGAWKAFGADDHMDEDEIRHKVKAWRNASPMIVKFWYGLQDAAFMAVQNPGHCYSYQAPATAHGQPPAIIYGVKDDILYCRLPSGRNLTYHAPRLDPDTDYYGRPSLRLTYMGWNSDYKKGPQGWMRLDTWGGKLVENVVQAVSRDLLAFAMPALERAGYPVVLHVHDEIAAEVAAGAGDVSEFEKIMSTVPAWAQGWPIKAAGGWRGKRYRKD